MYRYVLNSVVKISAMFAKYFEYYTIILGGGVFFVGMLYVAVRSYILNVSIEVFSAKTVYC